MQEIDELSIWFWEWRRRQQPRSSDDIPRLDRPPAWLPDTTAEAAERDLLQAGEFDARLREIRPTEVADRIDHRLLRSAIARVSWELERLRIRESPRYWIDQSIGPVFDLLLRPGVDAARVSESVRLLRAVPSTLSPAVAALTGRAAGETAALAAGELVGIDARLDECAEALGALVPAQRADLVSAARDASAALVELRRWLTAAPELPAWEPIGAAGFEWFLREVACIPLATEQIAEIGRREYERAVWLDLLHRNRNAPLPSLPADAAEQITDQEKAEHQVREFYENRNLLSQPTTLGRYLNRPLPRYLEPLHFLGVTDYLTGPDRLDEDGLRYLPEPTADLPYFEAANAYDPRTSIVHEGAHYKQLALSWRNPRPVRRHYYDSGANEGIAFYNEELMLASGLFDDAPYTATVMYNFMRLRALRVTVDVDLARGRLSIDQAAASLESRVPMDHATAWEEAAFFADTPGQALSYQIGKTQLIALVADAARLRGPDLDLRAVHDYLWRNGNVPIALLRWELLGLTDELADLGV